MVMSFIPSAFVYLQCKNRGCVFFEWPGREGRGDMIEALRSMRTQDWQDLKDSVPLMGEASTQVKFIVPVVGLSVFHAHAM